MRTAGFLVLVAAETVLPPDAQPEDIPARDEVGPTLAVVGVIGAGCLALVMILLVRVVGGGRRRGFRPPRLLEVACPDN